MAFVSVRDIHNQRKDIVEQEMPREYRQCLVRNGRNSTSCNLILGAIQFFYITLFSGNLTPTHPLITPMPLNLHSNFFSGNLTALTLHLNSPLRETYQLTFRVLTLHMLLVTHYEAYEVNPFLFSKMYLFFLLCYLFILQLYLFILQLYIVQTMSIALPLALSLAVSHSPCRVVDISLQCFGFSVVIRHNLSSAIQPAADNLSVMTVLYCILTDFTFLSL